MRREVNFKQKNKSVNEYVSRKVDNRKKNDKNEWFAMHVLDTTRVCVWVHLILLFSKTIFPLSHCEQVDILVEFVAKFSWKQEDFY